MPRRRQKRSRLTPLSAEITDTVRRAGRATSGVHPEIWARWSAIVGPELAQRAIPSQLRNRVLYVSTASSVWLQELSFIKDSLLERLREQVGPGVVRDLRFAVDPRFPRAPSPSEDKPAAAPGAWENRGQADPDDPRIHQALSDIEDPDLREQAARAVARHSNS